ncbi:hypothetical protein CI610_03302 [invertebrate metagenome]|uniref:Endonuclease/exonuclease/phosphatase domain-containing protein n=1 Tax=invertebrate metagenome TaxID=1711999 RepID=A0A2H9T3K2_9ZZZZ
MRSLRNKISIIEAEFENIDIVCITESHLNQQISDVDIRLQTFSNKLFRKDRSTGPGGGIIVYHKDDVVINRRLELERDDIELLWLEVRVDNHKFLLGCIYRPDNNVDYWVKLDDSLTRATDTSLDVILTGDINIDMLNIPLNDHLSRLLIKHNLSSLISEPTRITPDSATSIDVIFTNNLNLIKNTHVSPPFCSDHSPVHAQISFTLFKQASYKKPLLKYDEADFDSINNALLNIDWLNISSNQDSNTFNSFILDSITEQVNTFIPSKVITIRPNDKPWMNNIIRLKMRQRNRIHKNANLTNTPHFWEILRFLRSETIDLIREAKGNYIKTLENSLNENTVPSDKWWKIAKSITNFSNKSTSIPPLESNEQLISHPIDKAELLNNHFTNISTSSPDLELPQTAQPYALHSLTNIHVTEQDVMDQLSILNVNKPPGPDGIVPKIVKKA